MAVIRNSANSGSNDRFGVNVFGKFFGRLRPHIQSIPRSDLFKTFLSSFVPNYSPTPHLENML